MQVGLQTLSEVVGIDELVARIVGRVDVNHLHLAEVRLLQELEYLKVVPLDEEILGLVEVDRLLAAGLERAHARLLNHFQQIRLSRPRKPEALALALQDLAKGRLKLLPVHRVLQLSRLGIPRLGECFGKKLLQLPPLLLSNVHRLKWEFMCCGFGAHVQISLLNST